MRFLNRTDAGRQLAARLAPLAGGDLIVLGLPRGGVPVANEVARALGAPLDVIVVRKLGVPYQPELAMGAVGEGGVLVRNDDVIRAAGISDEELEFAAARGQAEVEQRVQRFRRGRPGGSLTGRTALLVDDGIATGSTARAACRVARQQGAATVILAVPVAPAEAVTSLRRDADQVVCLHTPVGFGAVGEWYADFSPTTDDEVARLLAAADRMPGDLVVPEVARELVVPEDARGVVVFAHGSGSSRHSPRNRAVAAALNRAGLATLLLDLLTPAEEESRANVFDIELLATRLTSAINWVSTQPRCEQLNVGLFGASTGAAAALWAAGASGSTVRAVVSRGGRPDLAQPRLPRVTAPTLLIVGGLDEEVLALNRVALAALRCEKRLSVVPGATHLFSEPGTLDVVATLAADWFLRHLGEQGRGPAPSKTAPWPADVCSSPSPSRS